MYMYIYVPWGILVVVVLVVDEIMISENTGTIVMTV